MTLKEYAAIINGIAEQHPSALVVAYDPTYQDDCHHRLAFEPEIGWFAEASDKFISVKLQPLDDHLKINAVCVN